MKKIVLLTAIATALFAASDLHKADAMKKYKNERLCKVFQQKIIDYKKHMRSDEYAKATLESYEKRAAIFCGTTK